MSKEKKEAIALIIVATVICIVIFVMLVIKPRLNDIAEKRKAIKKITVEIDKQKKQSRQLIELASKKEKMETSISAAESGLFGGISIGDLSRTVNTVVKTGFKSMKLNYLGDRAELLPVERYTEISNELKIQNCEFYEAVRFIGVLETSNPGMRITNLAMESASVNSEANGMVTIGIEVKLMGMHEGTGVPAEWAPPKTPGYEPTGIRNPFGTGGTSIIDPEQEFKDRANNIKVTMNTADSIWVKDTSQPNSGARECLLKKSMPVFEPVKVRLIDIQENYFVVKRDDGKSFKLMVRQAKETSGGQTYERGTIREVIEIK
jgi:hypothetical protein